ncbi:MAG TPA: hypothetical protein VED40_01955 [Azospirillaceae bacterium]|nr:hypothetical protein [Azospirillaceae bacterium]
MTMTPVTQATPAEEARRPLPLEPVLMKVAGDALLAATLVNAMTLPDEVGVGPAMLVILLGLAASMTAGIIMMRTGHRFLWEVVSTASLGAMAALLAVNAAPIASLVVGAVAWYRWKRLERMTG